MTLERGSSSGSSSNNTERVQEVVRKNNLTGSFGSGRGSTSRDREPPRAHAGKTDDGKSVINIRPVNTSIISGASSTVPQAHMGSDNGGAVGTTVNQRPTPNPPTPSAEGPEGTVVTNGPRSDFSVVLAGQVGRRPDRSPARSNNFISLIGGAGGLGRRSTASRRSLIGGA